MGIVTKIAGKTVYIGIIDTLQHPGTKSTVVFKVYIFTLGNQPHPGAHIVGIFRELYIIQFILGVR